MFLLLGEGCGKRGQNAMYFFVQYYETRASVNIFYYEEEGETIASLKDDVGTYPLAEEADMLADVEKVAGRSVTANVVDVVNDLCTEGRLFYPC